MSKNKTLELSESRSSSDKIAALSSILTTKKSDHLLSVGRLAQAYCKGEFQQQIIKELERHVNRGGLGDEKEILHSEVGANILNSIETENVDNEKYRSLKRLFKDFLEANELGDKQLRKQLIEIVLRLDGNDIIVLAANYKLAKNCYRHATDRSPEKKAPCNTMNAKEWSQLVAREIGHGLISLVERSEVTLVENKIIAPRREPPKSNDLVIDDHIFRLSDLGMKMGESLDSE